MPVKLTGTMEEFDGYSIIDNYSVPINPKYISKNINGYIANVGLHLGFNIPIFQTSDYSIGTHLNLGLGYQTPLKDFEGMESAFLDFPQYVYYKNFSGSYDFGISLGYKINRGPIPYNLIVLAFDFYGSYNNDEAFFRIYTSLFRERYYQLLTNGEIKPFIKIGEFGFSYVIPF
ncbi:MAG: hypothetical protein JXR58_08610 [Bacteroidales bacterium]|nr:hypothetical protein [Bacteroidales bacterium]